MAVGTLLPLDLLLAGRIPNGSRAAATSRHLGPQVLILLGLSSDGGAMGGIPAEPPQFVTGLVV